MTHGSSPPSARPTVAELARSFDDMSREIANLIAQMTATDVRKYLQEALFVNTITYENQRAAAYIKRVGGRPARRRVEPSRKKPVKG